mmetsp:Transcript_13958/g.40458  ORF Transcript_13958/g.40458 Transcript_13958/m.40458 type:complete len:470 (-) Transcript_13958:5660-7069(-)
MLHAHEVVVPAPCVRRHEEAHEAVRQQQLHLLVVVGRVALRVGRVVFIGAPPLVAARRQLVRREAAGTRREAACGDNAALAVPRLVALEHLGVRRHVLRRHLRQLVWLRVQPAERLQVGQVVVLREARRQVYLLVVAPLRRHHDAADLLDLRVVGRADAVHVAGDLRAQVGDADELLQEVLGHHVRVAGVADVVRVDVDMVHSQVEVGGGDGADTPFRLGAKRRLLVRRRCRDDHVVAVHVGRLGRDGGHLAALARLLLDLGNLLPLLRWRRDLRAQDDVADLGLRQRLYVDVVLLCVVSKDQVLQRNLDLDPLLVREARPHVVRLRDNRLVRPQDHARLLWVDVQRAQDEDDARERRVGRHGAQPVVVQVEQHHLRLGRLCDEVAELLELDGRLERQLKLGASDDDVGEVEAVDLERVKHALARNDDALGLLLHRQRPHERSHLLGRLPLGQLAQALLASPHARVDDL